jgi:hypothetical protein
VGGKNWEMKKKKVSVPTPRMTGGTIQTLRTCRQRRHPRLDSVRIGLDEGAESEDRGVKRPQRVRVLRILT